MKSCPRCQTALAPADYEGVQVDACSRCGGEWLDAGELRRIIDARERQWDPRDLEALKAASPKGVPVCEEYPRSGGS